MSTNLTFDKIRAAMELCLPPPQPSLAALKLIPSIHWPTKTVWRPHRREAHPLVGFLARFLPLDPWVYWSRPEEVDVDPILDRRAGVIFCSPRQARAIEQRIGGGHG